jgi:hypothetical protein
MDLVLVEFMVLLSAVLDDPLLHGSLGGDDRRRVVIVEYGVNRGGSKAPPFRALQGGLVILPLCRSFAVSEGENRPPRRRVSGQGANDIVACVWFRNAAHGFACRGQKHPGEPSDCTKNWPPVGGLFASIIQS